MCLEYCIVSYSDMDAITKFWVKHVFLKVNFIYTTLFTTLNLIFAYFNKIKQFQAIFQHLTRHRKREGLIFETFHITYFIIPLFKVICGAATPQWLYYLFEHSFIKI